MHRTGRPIRFASRASRSARADAVVLIRPARRADRAAAFEVESAAFGRPDEAELVERILGSGWSVPELSLVAEEEGRIVGHILFSHVELLTGDGSRLVLALAPMAVVPDRHGEGIGAALVRAGLETADRLGEPIVVVLGHATYYPRFGFIRSDELGIFPPPEYQQSHFFALALAAYEPTLRGTIAYPAAFRGL